MLGILSISSFSILFGYKLNDLLRKNFYKNYDKITETDIDHVKKEIENYIESHPLTKSLRSKSYISETRPYLEIPLKFKSFNFISGLLFGKGRISIAPYCFYDEKEKIITFIFHLGNQICGYENIVHGGLLATLIDEGFAKCSYSVVPNKLRFTANLNINYKTPAKANNYYVLKAKVTKIEGRKTWVEGNIETLSSYSLFLNKETKPVIIAEATALFIEPKNPLLIKKNISV
ncbi:hypothetical protein T552_02475 [Pneumocystis carinii B80]|uniref:Thioesterase domain-containing protein n=1 Tax=Pneumocystis carinii (strain B80) TaxID=1408658 RepID=A0A0W4ZF43_PNEC8|nr:hypothetical protein T552_02475 [Pneumocystis carinii B80]KTW26984.1 hypothetical protein T552_02475 [Pneumocystis carinii B80]